MRHYFIVSNVFRMSSKDIKNISFFLFTYFKYLDLRITVKKMFCCKKI